MSDSLSRHGRLARAELHERSSVSSPRVSPDGRRVASVVSTIDHDANTTRSRVWIDDRPVTAGPYDGRPTWSPDGASLAFTRGGGPGKPGTEVVVISTSGPGETRSVCSMADTVSDLAWSPDGRWLAIVARTRDERYEAEDERAQAPRRIDRYFSRLDGEDWVVDRPQHVYVVAADGTGTPRNLTPGDHQHAGVAWLADSTAVVTSAARHDTWDLDLCTDLYRVGLDGEITALTSRTGQYGQPAVSPDGTWIAFVGQDDARVYPKNAGVGIVRPDGSDRTWVSTGLDRTFDSATCEPRPVWIDDTSLLAAADDRGEVHVHRLTVDGAPPVRVTDGRIAVTGFHHASGTLAVTRADVSRPAELFVGTVGATTQVTGVTRPGRGWERFTVPCADGTAEIDAWMMLPDHDEASPHRLPLLLNVHGGPFTQYGEYYFDEAQMQAAAGFAVLMCNPRGGSGRDTAWGQSILGPRHPVVAGTGWGSVDVDDVLSVLDAALERYPVCDPDRVGMLGGSYGGFMATLLAARHGDRFVAVCSERAVNNLLTEEWSSDIGSMFRVEHGPSPVDDPDEYWRLSPVRLARDIHVPMLLIHSEQDLRCPINQAEELWMTLRMLGRDVTFYRFPGEGHELSRSGSPVHRRQRAEIILDFFADHLELTCPEPD